MPELFDARFRSYKIFYKNIQVGMTENELMKLRNEHYPQKGKRFPLIIRNPPNQNANKNSIYFFMNPEQKKYPRREAIWINFENGNIISKSYIADTESTLFVRWIVQHF